jgi:hypothetical protein
MAWSGVACEFGLRRKPSVLPLPTSGYAHITAVIAQSHAAYILQQIKAFSIVIHWRSHRLPDIALVVAIGRIVGLHALRSMWMCWSALPQRLTRLAVPRIRFAPIRVQMVSQYNGCICASPVTVYAAANDSVGLPQCRRRTSTGTFRRFCSSSCKKALALSVAECPSRCLPTCHSGHVSASDGPVVLLSSQNRSVPLVPSR